MGIITAIEPQKKNKGRVSLFIDGEFFCGLEMLTVLKFRLKEKQAMEESELLSLVLDSELTVAFEKAMGQINVRMRTRKEIEEYLKDKKFSEEVIASTIAKLVNYRYVDDAEFCRHYIAAKRQSWGEIKIKYMLSGLGVESSTIEEVYAATSSQVEEACRLAIKKFSTEPDKQKVFGFLMRKGFDSSTIKSAFKQIDEEGLLDGIN